MRGAVKILGDGTILDIVVLFDHDDIGDALDEKVLKLRKLIIASRTEPSPDNAG